MKKTLVVNGQRLNLNKAGGAGRYCWQLYKQLCDQNATGGFRGIDVFLENFQKVQALDAAQPEQVKHFSDKVKYAVYRCCPPILLDQLQKIYQYVRGGEDSTPPVTFDADKASALWAGGTPSTLLHELTNYTMIDEIGRLSLSPKLTLAVTFLDIQDYFYPKYFTDSALLYRRLSYTFYKDRADFFFAISNFTKKTMVDRLNINPDKIKVTHLAADDLLIFEPSEEIVSWVKSFGRYWIYPAKAWKHKNHEFLLHSIGKRKDRLRRAGIKLLLTGGFSSDDNLRLINLICDNNLHDLVNILGFVSDEQLQALIRGAEYLVFPSLFEGFGMPILEAMTLGCPVISSNAGSLPEVGGDAAMYFDPTHGDDFIALIDSVLNESGIDREFLIQKGFENAKRFSWEKTYCETVEVYNELF